MVVGAGFWRITGSGASPGNYLSYHRDYRMIGVSHDRGFSVVTQQFSNLKVDRNARKAASRSRDYVSLFDRIILPVAYLLSRDTTHASNTHTDNQRIPHTQNHAYL